MWVTIGSTQVQTDNIVTIDTYCEEYGYGLIINGIKCLMGYSRYNNLKDKYKFERIRQINVMLDDKVSEITGGNDVR